MIKKIQHEGERLSRETGVDFNKYQDPELLEKVSGLIGFHQQAAGLLFKYTGIFLVIIVALCFWFNSRGMGIVGIVLFLAAGIVFSLVAGTALGTRKMTEKAILDATNVIVLMLELVKGVKRDFARVPLSQMQKGLSYVVFIPRVSGIVRDNIKFFSGPVNAVIVRAMYYLTGAVSAFLEKNELDAAAGKEDKIGKEIAGTKADLEEDLGKFERIIDEAGGVVVGLGDTVSRIVAAPAKLMFYLALFIGVPLLLVIYLIFG